MKNFIFLVAFLLGSISLIAQTVYITPSGKKFHRENCKTTHAHTSITLSDAVDRGYTACRVCKPSTDKSSIKENSSLSNANGKSKSNSGDVSSNDNQCQGTTKAGNRCKRKASAGSSYCYQHG